MLKYFDHGEDLSGVAGRMEVQSLSPPHQLFMTSIRGVKECTPQTDAFVV